MSLLRKAKDAGLTVQVDGNNLLVRGPRRLEPVARELLRHKTIVMAALSSEWQCFYDERTAIRQHGGYYSRQEAERLAWGEVVNEWHMTHGKRTPHDLCAGCLKSIDDAEELLDHADGTRTHLADGFECITEHGDRWRGAAEKALVAMGLTKPAEEIEP
jgi:hypothetical protein